jgi:hypothetical protein
MDVTRRDSAAPYATEIIWDGGVSGTGQSGNGQALALGYEGGAWSPEHLLLLGTESSLMESFLAAARDADIRVLGYVSSGHLEVPDDPGAAPRLTLKPCIVVASMDDAERAALIATIVARKSIAGRLLGDNLRIGLEVQLESAS